MTNKDTLRRCLEAAVKLAFIRHDIEPEPDTATVDEIAADAAGACFGEECCDDKPIPEVAELLNVPDATCPRCGWYLQTDMGAYVPKANETA